ncbi:dynein heavy chain domain-containing protein 1 isoform X1 [Nothobranchius furzeri]
MFAAPPEDRFPDESSPTRSKDVTKIKVKKKTDSPKVTLPPLAVRPLLSCSYIHKNTPSDKTLSLLELPQLVPQAEPETKQKEGPLMAAALGAAIPIRRTQLEAESPAEKDEPIKVSACRIKRKTYKQATQLDKYPHTGLEVAHVFGQRRDPEEPEFFYLKEVDEDACRPYDLKVVHYSEAGSDHYIFSPNTVIHVTETGFGGTLSLSEWYRECVLWTALQEIPFIRNFRIKKAFARWKENKRMVSFQRKCKNLQDLLLVAVPQFREALHLFTRVIGELKDTHWMPLDDCKTYTIQEFKKVLMNKNEEYRLKLKKLSQYHLGILNVVKEETYRRHKELQMQLKRAKQQTSCSEPIHLLLAYRHQLKKELCQSEVILRKLGNFAALVHQMITQGLITITKQDAVSFLSLLKRDRSQQCCLFYVELCFTANSRPTVDSAVHEFHKAANESLLTSDNTIVQMCENLGFFQEISSKLCNEDQGLISDSKCVKHSATTGVKKEEVKFQSLRCMLAHQMMQPEANSLKVQGIRVQGCYRPFSKAQLEWHVNIEDVFRKAETEQAKIMQDTELEIQQVCDSFAWLKEIHSFVRQWSPGSLESMKDQPASVYEENIKKLSYWAQKVDAIVSSVNTSNQLFFISCTHTKETLRLQLSRIEKQVVEQLVEQTRLNSENLVFDLERMTAELQTEPQDVQEFAAYALRVRESERMWADMQKRLECILSLHNTICMNCRKMTEQELALKEKMLCLWESFIPILKQADSHVCNSLPSMTNALNTMVSFLVCDLKNTVLKASSGPFLDPSQDAKQMASELNYMCAHVQTLSAKLEEYNRSSQNMQEQPLDLTVLKTDVKKVIERKELWRIKAAYTTWLEEWKQLQLSQLVISQAQEKIVLWKVQTQSLIGIPMNDPVLEEVLKILESLSHQAEVMEKLTNTTLREKHMKMIFQGLGLLFVPENTFSVAEVLSQHPETHQRLIDKICRDAQSEWNMEQRFQRISLRWKDKLFQLDEVIHPACQHCEKQKGLTEEKPNKNTFPCASHCSCDDARFTITGLETLSAEVDNDLITLSIMLKSPQSVEFRLQLEECDQSLQELAKLLKLFESYQQLWAFLSKTFGETSFYDQEVNLLKHFQQVDEAFKELMSTISADLHVLNFVSSEAERFHGNNLYQTLTDGLSMMDSISNQMMDLLHNFRDQFPRLWFLSDRELTQLLSYKPLSFALQTVLSKCYKGISWLEVEFETRCDENNVESYGASSENYKQMKVRGIFGNLREHIAFEPPLEPNPNALVWLCVFEKQLKLTMIRLMKQCAVLRNQLEPSSQDSACDTIDRNTQLCCAEMIGPQLVLDLLSDFPLQSLLVVEEAVWCKVVLGALQEKSPLQLSKIKTYNSLKLKNLGNFLRKTAFGSKSKSLVSKYTNMCLRALVQLTMNHAQQLSQLMEVQCDLESSFEWLCLMKYHINSENQSPETDNLPCYVDVLGHQFQYGFEYYGPEDLLMVHAPSTEKAVLGIVLALTRYRCGLVSGPSMTAKTNTVAQLGKALGRQYVVKQCFSSMASGVVQQMLLGALQTGAWLLLESVELLTPGVLSLLGQFLEDIHQSFFKIQRKETHRPNEVPDHKSAERVTDFSSPQCNIVLLGKNILPNPSYGCVLIPSKEYESKIPESLRFSTRPIGLTHPDYRITTEVTLTSIGFSEASSLSHRLVSLIRLAKDSNCLPDSFTGDSCFFDVLQKIISTSEMFLQQAMSQDESSNETKVSTAEHTDLSSSQNMSAKHFEKNREETTNLPKLCSSRLSIIQSLKEEAAIVKAVLTVLVPEPEITSQFHMIFKDTFPIVCQFPHFQHHIEEREMTQLQHAVTEELKQEHLYSDMEIVSKALRLYQALKLSPAVILIGPPGSGKSACHTVLAGALNRLAYIKDDNVFDNENTIKKNTSTWCFVDTLVLFPNSMSHDELFGCFCEKKGWKDGAISTLLSDLGRFEVFNNRNEIKEALVMKWLIMDGEPVGQPCWLDNLTTLCSSQHPCLHLSSGETLPSQSHLKLLMEVTHLQDASPFAVTRCSLVYFTGVDLWKAVWKSEMDVLLFEHKLDQEVLDLWKNLADDLFSSTFILLGRYNLTSAYGSCNNNGLQAIMSFVRILEALVQHFEKQIENSKTASQKGKRGMKTITNELLCIYFPHIVITFVTPFVMFYVHSDGSNCPGLDSQNKQDLLTRNLFLVAYIWGFGGHLHSRHWPQFDLLVRQLLFSSRYKILVPDKESVFEQFLGFKSQIHANDSQLTNSIIPKFGLYKHLLNIMLEAKQPVLLAGEPSSGKTTLCNTLSFERPHINLPASPLLSSREFRIILKNCCHKNWNNNVGSVKKEPGLLLFVDDLHEAPRDVFGKVSAALETLRQSISQEQIGMFDTYFFKALSSKTVSYMATSCVFTLSDPVRNAVSSRLSRLFSIFVLPSLSKDVLLSIHSPWMKIWLKEMSPSHSGEKMSNRIITATKNVYESVCAQFHPTSERPQLTFSHHDIQKVFSGMYLWQDDMSNTAFTEKNKSIPSPSLPVLPGLPASDLKIVHLWIHECMRTFSDRLCSEDERKTFLSVLVETADAHFGFNLLDNSQPDTSEAKEASQKFKSDHTPTKSTNISSRETNFKPQPVTPLHLKHYKAIETSLVYGPDFSETLMFLNPEHNFKDKRLYVKQDLDVIWPELLRLIDSKEEANHVDNIHNTVTRYSVHRQGVSQLLHIFRTLLIPGGHGVLIGSGRGTGRKTTVRLAAYLTGCQLMEVRSNNENKVHETLKEAGNQTDKNGVNVIILVHEDISSPVREEILIAMAQKVFPGHCTEDELSSLVSRVTAMECVERYHMGRWISEKVLSQIHKNVHVFLLMPFNMSSDENTQSFNTQMAKAVKLSCCVEVYQPWSNQSWVEIAVQNLKLCSSEMFRGCSEDSLSVAMAAIYQSAHQYASIFLETQPFSPRTYTEFIAFFSYFCNQLPKQWVNKNNRVSSALARMDVLNNEVGKWKEQILRLQKETENKQQLHKMHLKAVDDKKNLLQLASKTCEAKKNKLNQLEEKIHQVQKLIKPVLLSGLKILQCLKPSDFEEVRHYRDPPDGVVKIMDAVCLLFNRPPGWESAKQLIMQPDFFQEMEFYDYQSLTKAQLQQLGQIAHSPLFVPESVQEVSKACESLCRWVQAVCEFCSMQHHLVVKQQLEVQAREAQNQLLSAEKHKKEVRQLLEHAEFQLQSMESELEDLMLQLYETEAEEEEATLCAAKLEMHVKNWRGAFQVAETRFQNTPGDALLLAAVVSYFGPFEPHLRTELVSKWKELCWTGSIDMNPKDLRTSLFTPVDSESAVPSLGFPIAVTERLQLPVDQTLGITDWQLEDVLPARLMVKLMLWGLTNACMQRWPLLADTEQHLQISSLNWSITGVKVTLEEELRCRLVVCADDSKLLDKLDHASEEGWRVLITHLERATPSPEFMARLTRPVDCRLPGLQQISSDSPQTVNPEFCLFLSTNLPVRLLSSGIHPSILAQLFVVDLSLSSEEIQELMLTQLLQSEHRELLIQHRRYQNYNQFLQKKLVSKEDALIDCTLQSDTSLQKDSNFLSCVAVCQEEMKEVQAEIKLLSEELKHHESLLAAPRQLMKLAAALYQALQAVARLSPGYIFSLHEFINVMQDAFSVKYRPLVPYKPGKAAESMLPELMNSMVLQLLVQYRPCLFKKHFAVLKLLVSLAVLQHNQLCSEAEKLAFLRGLGDVEQPVAEVQTQTFSSNLPSWIPPDIHSELFTLENIPSFRGLIASLHTSPIQWQEYIQFTSSTVTGPVPCCSHSHLFLLQRALLWKTILPSSLEKVADAIAVCSLCLPEKTAESPHSGNLKALSRYLTKNKGPIILAFPNPDEDTWIGIQPLHIINQMACCVGNEHEVYVKVICFGEQCDTEIILSTMDEAISEGHWLVFNNCHLLDHWTDNVVAHLSQLISFTEENPEIHPDFKLWFVTQENASHFLPAAVRMCAQLLVCDSPWDLREELSCSLQHVDWVSQPQSSPRVSDDNMEMLVRCAIFHSVLMQRQNYRSLGFGRIYHWSQEDLLGLIDAYICIASLCHDKTNVLQFIAVNLLHGSYVTDSADSEVVEKIAKTLFTTESSLSGSGPHMISDLISSCGRLDLSRSLQVLEKHFQDPAVSDPVLLGLSVDVAPEITRINSHHLNLLLQASQSPLGAMRSFSTEQNQLVKPPDYNHAAERLQALKKYLSLREDSTIRNVGTLSRSPLRNFLEAEWNDLIDLVSSLLLQLQRPVQYASSFSSPLNSCDLSWLEKRAKLLSAYCWSDSSSDPPGAYRLSAFKNPRGFLVALIREGAHKYYKYSSDIILQFQVLSKDTNPAVLPPDAVYLCGLELRGASWDTEQGVLQEAVFPQPVLMPLLCVKAGVRSRDSAAEPLSSCSYLMDSGNLQVESVSQQTALPAYYCPLYVNQEEEIGNSGLSDINIITKVPLYTQISPVLCSLRRVRLVCAL